jgi:hypothetical protein
MIKYIFILINFAGLFLINLFSDTEILVDNQIPTSIVPGEKQEVHITINKKDIQGFAKMELVLPAGFVATPGETQGASFTYTQQKARFVWMNLPNAENFEVTYYLECLEGMKGNYSVNGTFSYIRENKRVDYFIPIKQIVVGAAISNPTANNNSLAGNDVSTPDQNTSSLNQLAKDTSVESTASNSYETNDQVGTSSPQSTTGNVEEKYNTDDITDLFCDRTIEKTSEGLYKVELVIHNNNIEGFAKILEVVPVGCTTKIIQDGGAVITAEKNSIKFVWFEIPTSPEIHLTYEVSCNVEPVITGKLSFVLKNKPMELVITNSGTKVDTEPADSDLVTETTTTPKDEPKNQVDEPAKTDNSSDTKTVSNTSEKNENNKNSGSEVTASNKTEQPESSGNTDVTHETGITYKVQILAAHRVVNKTYFQQKHSFVERFNIENHEGWVKYTIGKFSEYKDARDNRERIRKDYGTLPGPFVTAYNNGERITVQEALLITKQQWYN